MAEGYLKHYAGDLARVVSAGIETHGLNPKAVEVMLEDGIDISGQASNKVDEFLNSSFDFVITVCDHARENCPLFPSTAKMFHRNFPDPAKAQGTTEEVLNEFRRTRDLVKAYCYNFVEQELKQA
jgi:arsenate reductase